MPTATDLIRGRQVVIPLTNKAGADVPVGAVVVISRNHAGAFERTTSETQSDDMVGVCLDAIASDASGRVCFMGYVPMVNLASAAAIGDQLYTSTTAGQGTPSAIAGEGAFGQALAASSTPPAVLWGKPAGAGGQQGGAVATDMIWDAKGDLAVATAANTAAKLAVGANGTLLQADSTQDTGLKWETPRTYPTFNVPGTLAITTGKLRLSFPYACTITNVRATVGTAPTGAAVIIDLHKNGATIFTNQDARPSIAIDANVSLTNVPDIAGIAANDYLTLEVDAVGSTEPGSDLVVTLECTVP